MTPYAAVEYQTETARQQPTRTYCIKSEKVVGYADGLEAMQQAIKLALGTQRYRHEIFSWDYGSELNAVLGQDYQLAQSEAKRYITEALAQDERITDVNGFEFKKNGRTMTVSFTVSTIFGEIEQETEVYI